MRNIGYELPPVVHHDILGWLDVCMHINHAWHDGHSRHVTYDRILRRIYYRARTDICYPAISNNYRSIIMISAPFIVIIRPPRNTSTPSACSRRDLNFISKERSDSRSEERRVGKEWVNT